MSLPSKTSRLLSAAASTNSTLVAAGTTKLGHIQGFNARASAVYLKLYNKATAPTVGTDTPIKTLYLPASSAFVFDFANDYLFPLGLGFGLTTGVADADTGVLVAGDILALNVDYSV